MPLDVFKGVVDEVYVSIRKLFSPAIEGIVSDSSSGRPSARLLSVPLHEPVFASLSLAFDKPTLDTSGLKRKVVFDGQEVNKTFDLAARNFAGDAAKIEQLARGDGWRQEKPYLSANSLEIMAQIVPGINTSFDSVEITGSVFAEDSKSVVVNAVEGERIKAAYLESIQSADSLSGVIIELNKKSGTFVLRAVGGRETTCDVGKRVLEQLHDSFRNNLQLKINGPIKKRQRRDSMRFGSIELSNGTVITRSDD